MLGFMGNTRVEATSDASKTWQDIIESGVRNENPDIGVLATHRKNGAAIMFWNYHDDDKTAPDVDISLFINGLNAKKVQLLQYRIDRDHSNSYEAWKKMGLPQNPDSLQYAVLENESRLQTSGKPVILKMKNGRLVVNTSIQRQGVGLLLIEVE
jgi:xylan 1,4-beta-xylosidase